MEIHDEADQDEHINEDIDIGLRIHMSLSY